jgi:hypothetical protein
VCGRTLNGVSTRKLILASLICGLLILVAGTVKLLQTANETPATSTLLSVGSGSTIGGRSVMVNSVEVTSERTLVNISLSGLVGTSPVDGWLMLANGDITEPVGARDCPTSADATTCTIEFAASIGTPTIIYSHEGERRQWLGS